MFLRKHYRTVVLSDIHLGTAHSKVEEVSRFLSSINCDRLILNGDIIDGWHLRKNGTRRWQPAHTRFFKILMKMMENCGTEIVYVRGNHDDFLDNLAPMSFANIRVVKEYTLDGANGKRYFVTHGDIFDRVTTQMCWLAHLGDMGYTFLLWFNGVYNRYRAWRGKSYYSLSQRIKQRVKSAVSYISDFETTLARFAESRRCDGIICGHIHHPDDRYYGQIHYLNSGDWVETMSALTESKEGDWNIVYYAEVELDSESPDMNLISNIAPAS